MTKEQAELFKAETTWFHVFKDMIDNGDMAKLDGSAIKVYLVVKSYTNFSTGRSFPAIDLVAEKAGLSKVQVIRCLKILEQAEYIIKAKDGRHNVYTLREKVSIKDSAGKQHAVATWDYIPNGIREAVAHIKNATITGEMVGSGLVNITHIQNLTVNVASDQATQVNINTTDLTKLPLDVQAKLKAMRDVINK